MTAYTQLPHLSDYLLEESYVLEIEVRPTIVRFSVDLVLTVGHSEYRHPLPGEQYCFRRGFIEFTGVERIFWTGQGAPPARDANDELDYGNIDNFEYDPPGYHLDGGWGCMELIASEVRVVLEGDSNVQYK